MIHSIWLRLIMGLLIDWSIDLLIDWLPGCMLNTHHLANWFIYCNADGPMNRLIAYWLNDNVIIELMINWLGDWFGYLVMKHFLFFTYSFIYSFMHSFFNLPSPNFKIKCKSPNRSLDIAQFWYHIFKRALQFLKNPKNLDCSFKIYHLECKMSSRLMNKPP